MSEAFEPAGEHPSRRSLPRLRLALNGAAETVTGHSAVTLEAVSLTGARIGKGGLRVGADIFLRCGPADCFGSVIWSNAESSGIAFDEPLARDVVLGLREIHDCGGGDPGVNRDDWALGR